LVDEVLAFEVDGGAGAVAPAFGERAEREWSEHERDEEPHRADGIDATTPIADARARAVPR
jgi:hypothetical protein